MLLYQSHIPRRRVRVAFRKRTLPAPRIRYPETIDIAGYVRGSVGNGTTGVVIGCGLLSSKWGEDFR